MTAAVSMLADEGIEQFTMASVSQKASLSVGGVYGRFPTKEALLREVKDVVLLELETTIRGRVAEGGSTLRAGIAAFVAALAESFAAQPRLYSFIFVRSTQDKLMRQRGARSHEALLSILRDSVTTHRQEVVRDLDQATLTLYEIISQSLTMRVTTAGSLDSGERPYSSSPDWDTFAGDLTDVAYTYLTTAPSEP